MTARITFLRALPVVLLFVCLSDAARAADPVEALKACARVSEQAARYACYDELGQRLLEEESSQTPSLPDDIGGADFEEQSESGRKEDRGLITSCTKGRDDRWYFYFDNGQVWKESNRGRHRFKECEFIAYVYRDGFGYKMRIEDNNKTLRVQRIR